ncbi:MAG: hypothetical protein O3B72_11600, partial [Proteobacteria bacterium]|nr:hypothetical protein [Pseudomonadota bacterium]
MSDLYYDDENYNDGFNDDSYHQGMNLDLWRRLLGYALHYRQAVIILGVCAFLTAVAEIAFPLITRGVIDEVGRAGVDANLAVYGFLYAGFTVLLGCSVGGFIWYGGKLRTHIAHDIRMDGFRN